MEHFTDTAVVQEGVVRSYQFSQSASYQIVEVLCASVLGSTMTHGTGPMA